MRRGACPKRMPKKAQTFRLTEETIKAVRELSDRLGLSQAGVVEMAVRLLAEERLKTTNRP